MFKTVKWKLKEHRDLLKFGINHSYIRDTVSKKYRRKYYNDWLELPEKFVRSQGFQFTKNTPVQSLREIFIDEIYNVRGFTPEKGQLVIDVGANYGDSSIWWSKTFESKVIAFEPLPNLFEILEENIRMNRSDVIPYNIALGNGNVIIGKSDGIMISAGGNLKINSRKLDSYLFDKVDILKIDVEGFEFDVLKGSEETIVRFKPRIILETHSKALRKICHRFLISHGYILKKRGRTVFSESSGMDEVTNLFYSIQ